MEEDSKFSYFFLGLGLGVAAGLLFAPKTGAETRELLRSKADEGTDYVKRRSAELRDSAADALDKSKAAAADALERSKAAAADAIEKGKTAVSRQRDNLNAAVEAGKQAYREAVVSNSSDVTEGI